jgi:hypothetical protein
MSTSLYDLSVASYLQILTGVIGFLDKGASHCQEQGLDLEEIVTTRLHPEMLPFRFQLISVAHHSIGAIEGIQSGVFGPPPSGAPEYDYAGLQDLAKSAQTRLQGLSADDINGLEGKALHFEMGETRIPFTAENFVLSFSLPNFYFHATTAYDILRMKGVPLGKRDFLGAMRVGT